MTITKVLKSKNGIELNVIRRADGYYVKEESIKGITGTLIMFGELVEETATPIFE